MWWRIYYADGSSFSNAQGTPFEAPRQGVVAIAQEDENTGYVIHHALDYFYWEPEIGGWANTDLIGAFDHLVRAKQPLLLIGRMMARKAYYDLLQSIARDCGPKQGWQMNEVKL